MTAYTFDESIVSDLHKDARGYRPVSVWWEMWTASSDEDKQSTWDSLLVELEWESTCERADQEAAVKRFEGRIELLMNMGASNRETAIRWIIESMDFSETDKLYGGEYVCFELGLPYNMKETFTHLMC